MVIAIRPLITNMMVVINAAGRLKYYTLASEKFQVLRHWYRLPIQIFISMELCFL